MEINHDQSAAPQSLFFATNAFYKQFVVCPDSIWLTFGNTVEQKKIPLKMRGKNYLGSKVDGLWTLIGHGPLHISTELVFRILIV